MFAVIFEVLPKQGRSDDYLEQAKFLKPKLEAIDGFIDNERYASRRRKGRMLSFSTWRDEKSVVRWRTQGDHHGVQEKGRFEIFEDYHIRIGEVTHDTDPPRGLGVDQQRFDETEIGAAKCVSVTELMPTEGGSFGATAGELAAPLGLDTGDPTLADYDVFDSIYSRGKILLLASWRDAAAAERWTPTRPEAARSLRHRRIRVIRDYGMFERREAPQFYPEVKRAKPAAA